MLPINPKAVGTLQFIPGILALLFLRPALQNRDIPGSRSFVAFSVGVFIYSLGLAAGNFTGDLQASVAAWNVSLLGGQILAVTWFTLAGEVTGKFDLSRPLLGGLGAYVAGFQLVLWTNSIHNLVYVPQFLRDGVVLEANFQLGFWLLFGSSYLLIIIAVALLLLESMQSTGLRRKQTLILGLALFPTLTTNMVATLGFVPGDFDITVFGYVLTAFFFAVALYSGRFLDIEPVARRTAMAEMKAAMVTLDRQDRVLDCNSSARELFDVDQDYIGTPATEFFDGVDDELLSEFEAAVNEETEVTATLNGDVYHFMVSVSPVGDQARNGRVIVLHDITEQTRRERELRRQNERLDQFASVVSHDLRNPLGIAKTYLNFAEDTGDSDDFAAVRDAHDRMDEMIADLLTLARAETSIEETERVDLAAAAKRAWRTAQTDGARLETAVSGAIEADPDLLTHVLENLFRNAVDHNEPSITVTIGSLDGDGFYVEDDGRGIPPDRRETVLEQGYTTSEDGTGFGLYIVRDFVDAHGWEINVTESDDGGARFEITT